MVAAQRAGRGTRGNADDRFLHPLARRIPAPVIGVGGLKKQYLAALDAQLAAFSKAAKR